MKNTIISLMPPAVSTEARSVDHLLGAIHIYLIAFFLVWLFILIKFLVRKKSDYPDQNPHKTTFIEILFLVIKALIIFCISLPFTSQVMGYLSKATPDLQIRVIAEQYNWNFHYP